MFAGLRGSFGARRVGVSRFRCALRVPWKLLVFFREHEMKLRAIFCLLLFWGLATGGGARAASPDATSDLVTAIVSNKAAAAQAVLDAGADINGWGDAG